MRRLSFVTLVFLLLLAACAPAAEPQVGGPPAAGWPKVAPVASYDIQVKLDADAKTLTGHETVTYVNTTDTPIPDVVLHLYLNAFRDDHSSIFMQEAGPAHRGFSLDPQFPGNITVTGIRLADGTSLELELIEDHTLARAALPAAVPPGGSIQLDIDFTSTLPKVFARTGFYEDFFMVGQWFPKLGVWQSTGWNAYPFHANSEFFADFGDYDVAITLPEDYVTGASGLPVASQANGDGTRTDRYHAEAVIDFAWTASPHFKQAARVVDGVELVYMYLPEHDFTVDRALDAAEAAVSNFGAWYGPYPYPRLTVVDVPGKAGGAGGMEYPMLVTAGLEDLTGLNLMKGQGDRMLEIVTIHEIGHEWWYAVAAFNEAEEPWLDEGFTDYSTVRLMTKAYGPANTVSIGGLKLDYVEMRRMDYLATPAVPMYGKAWDFDMLSYGVAAYSKPALSLTTLENVIGEEQMLKLMSTFFRRYQFKHPTTRDFQATAREVTGRNLDWFFDGLVYGKGALDYSVTAVDEHSVSVARRGELVIPTEVLVTFSDGTSTLEAWDGSETQKTFSYPDRSVVRAEVDPQRKIVVDLMWSDNGLTRRMDLWSWLALDTRFLYQIQNLLLGQGGL
jgi:hypothetical protein